jgi:putative transposase
MSMYRSAAHAKYDCRYHIVWIPKYRKKVLLGKLKERLKELINHRSEELRVIVLKGAIEPDHVHLYVSMPPSLSVSQYLNFIKGMTSRVLRQEFAEDLAEFYWKPILWADGYFVATVGEINDEIIRQYIASQETREKEELNSKSVWDTTRTPNL